jgi:hypothetical protein
MKIYMIVTAYVGLVQTVPQNVEDLPSRMSVVFVVVLDQHVMMTTVQRARLTVPENVTDIERKMTVEFAVFMVLRIGDRMTVTLSAKILTALESVVEPL